MSPLRVLCLVAIAVAIAVAATVPAAAQDDDWQRRAAIVALHRPMGITTWFSLLATTTIGTLRYANVVGFGDPLCAEGGSPIFGRDFGCGEGHRTWHLISASFSTASYAVTRVLAALMPSVPEDELAGTAFGRRLFWHRLLSWVHLAGMIAMPILGFAASSTNDPADRDDLATAHLIVGYTTFAAVSASAALMIF